MRDILFSAPGAEAHIDAKFKKWMHFDLKSVGLGEVPYMGVNEVRRSVAGIREHRHVGEMEISYLASGEQVWNVGGRDYRMRGNEILVKHPGEPYGTGNHPYGKGRHYALRLRFPAKGKSFLTLEAREARPLIDALRTLPRRHFLGDSRLWPLFDEIVLLLISPDKSPLKRLHVARLLQELLCIVIACGQTVQPSQPSPDIRKVQKFILDNVCDNPTLSEMARVGGLSLAWFKEKFKQQVGVAPMEYLMRTKVEEAKKLLRNNPALTVTDVAHRLGFSSSQYFATVCKRFTNKKPSEFRNNRLYGI